MKGRFPLRLIAGYVCFQVCCLVSAVAQKRPAPVGPQPMEATAAVRSAPFVKQYRGKLGNKKVLTMVLIHWGNGELAGWYSLNKKRERLELRGHFTRGDQFELKEYAAGDYSGAFFGSFEGGDRIGGVWINDRGKHKQAFSANSFRFAEASEPWEGNWYFRESQGSGRLLIGNVGAESFDYALLVIRRRQLSQIIGTVTRRGRRAFFEDPGFGTGPCRLRFDLEGETILLTMESSAVVCGFGAPVDGRFVPVGGK